MLEDLYFSPDNVQLTAKEMNALAIADSWRRGEVMTANPVVGPDGSIEFLFGAEQPTVVAAAKRERDTIPETNEYLGDLDFGYTVKDKAPWKPVRVYSDGTKTILEMPERMRQTEAPTLLIVRKEGRIFRKSEQVMVNYRVQNGRYIVDAVFDQALLIAVVGGNQEKVTIVRTPGKGGK